MENNRTDPVVKVLRGSKHEPLCRPEVIDMLAQIKGWAATGNRQATLGGLDELSEMLLIDSGMEERELRNPIIH